MKAWKRVSMPKTSVSVAVSQVSGASTGTTGVTASVQGTVAVRRDLANGVAKPQLVVPLPNTVQWVNLAAMAAVGALVAAALRIPLALAVGLSAVVGAAIGWANGADIGDQVAAVRFIPGVALAGFMLAAYGIGCVRALHIPWMAIAFRVIGSWIAAVGILLLGL